MARWLMSEHNPTSRIEESPVSMDIMGINPTADVGVNFHRRRGPWGCLTTYLIEEHPIFTDPCDEWGSNDGDGLNAAAATRLADALDDDLANGAVPDEGDLRHDVKAFARFLRACGGFRIC